MRPPPLRIKTPDDPRIAAYTAIRERDLTGREGRFIIEGKVTLGVMLERGRFALESVFIASHRLEALAGLTARIPPDVPLYTADPEVFDTIAGYPVHRGVLACGLKAPHETADALLSRRRLLLAIGISNHDNVGALFRNAAAFGVDAILLDDQSCDPLYRKAIRVSAGTALWLPYHHGMEGGALFEAAAQAGHEIWATTPRASAPSLFTLDVPRRLAIAVGAEGPGLPETLLDAARPVRIPMAPGVDSVNVATAAAITLARVFAD